MRIFFLLSFVFLVSCTSKKKDSILVYTSTYKEVLALYDPALKKAFPEVEIKWFQAGSEVVATKLQSEISAGKIQADLYMTSDLFFAMELEKLGKTLSLSDVDVQGVPAESISPNKGYVISRFPVMGLAYNKNFLKNPPTSFKSLWDPQFKGKITMPSPLESGTALTSLLLLKQSYPNLFEDLRRNEVFSAGGNGATLARILSGEKPLGMVLLENVLQANERGQNEIAFVTPEEGFLVMPSPMLIFKDTSKPELARKVFQWFLSAEAQQILVKGWVYPVIPHLATPSGAPEWDSLKKNAWSLEGFASLSLLRDSLKSDFQKVMIKN